jgi:uncharacterized protein (TIGR00369 family)
MDQNDARWKAVAGIFNKANFISHLGMKLVEVGEGACSVELVTDERHLQHHGFVHAGVVATLADHAAGGAARSVAPAGSDVITIEFKINFLKPAPAGKLLATARVLRAGRTVIVAETEVLSGETLVSKLTSTLAVILEKQGLGIRD